MSDEDSDCSSTEHEHHDYLLDLCPERILLASVYATKMMFLRFQDSSQATDDKKIFTIIRKISCWHELILSPNTVKITNEHQVPDLFAGVFTTLPNRFFHDEGDLCGLHVFLLLISSNHILDKMGQGFGPKTEKEVSLWFDLMVTTKDSSLFEPIKLNLKEQFRLMIQKFNSLSLEVSTEEHEFFNHKFLFLHVAHLVKFYSKSPVGNDLPHSNHVKMTPTHVSMLQWEKRSGRLFEEIFELKSHGFLFFDCEDGNVANLDEGIQLPYMLLDESDDFIDTSDELPSLHGVHTEVINIFEKYISKNTNASPRYQSTDQQDKVDELLQSTKILLKNRRFIFRLREKQRRNYRKNKCNKKKAYHPKTPTVFERDMFCFGEYSSYHYIRSNYRLRASETNQSSTEASL